jgi:hypothetical protein
MLTAHRRVSSPVCDSISTRAVAIVDPTLSAAAFATISSPSAGAMNVTVRSTVTPMRPGGISVVTAPPAAWSARPAITPPWKEPLN